MNVSFLDMSHSHSNLYRGVHVILCGQDREGSVTIVAHALVPQETGEYYDKAFEIFLYESFILLVIH